MLLGTSVFAQQYPLVKYTVREGLVQNQVLSLLKDSRGYVWCGTWYGLSRFNGETFENFTEAEGLWNAGVSQVIEDDDGRIWIMGGGRLASFDGKTFKKYKLPSTETGRIYFNKATKNVRFYDNVNQNLLEVKGDTVLPVLLPGLPDKVYLAHYDAMSDSYYFQKFDGKIIKYHQGRSTTLAHSGELGLRGVVQGDIHIDFRAPNGDHEYKILKNDQFTPFLRTTDKTFTVLSSLPYAYVFIHQNILYYLPPNTRQAEPVSEAPPAIPYEDLLNQSPSSTLWIPTEKGLWSLMLTGFKNFQDGEVPYAWSVVEDSEGKFLFLNYWKGLQEYDGNDIRFISQKKYLPKAVEAYKPLKITPGPDSWYYRAFRDQSGYCWLPDGTGLYRYKEGHFDFIRKGTHNLAFSIAEDVARKKLVVASSQHAYTVDIDPPFRTDSIRGKSLLFEGLVFCAVVSPNGDYWFSGRGIDRYNPDTKRFTSYTFEDGKIPTKGARMLYIDWNGDLWAGDDGVVSRYNPKKDIFEKAFDFHFQGLIGFAEQIDSTHIMFADMKNLYVLNLKKFNASGEIDIKTFNHHNGFMGMEPGQLGSYRDSKGRIWITSGSVLSVLDPTQLDLTTRPLRTMIASVNKRGVSFIHPEEVVEVPEGESIVNVKVETLGEDKPYNSQFSYKLEGEMDDWTDWQEQPLITLNNLSNGLHTLKVRSRSGDFNAHGESIATLHFRTRVAIWKSPDFYLYAIIVALVLLTALAVLLAVGQRRKRKMLQQQNRLEERERAMQLLQAQTIVSQMQKHFTSNTLSAIQRLALSHQAERASDNIVKMERLTRAYLEDSIFKAGEQNPFIQGIPLSREIYLLQMYVELMQLQHDDRFDFVLDVPDDLDTEDYKLPPFLIQPFVENAIKHGLQHRHERGTLRVQFRGLPDEVLLCRIEDDGVGRETARRIREQAPSDHESVSTELLRQRIALLNQIGYAIEFSIEDLEVGTVVSMKIGYS